MTENQIRELLRDSGERVPVGSPPHAGIAAIARRRRGRAVAAGAAALVVVVALGGAVLQQASLGGSTEPDPPQPAGDALHVSPGMRLVGANGVAVEVPASWPTTDQACGSPTEDFVYFSSDVRATARCAIAPNAAGSVSTLAIGSLDSAVGERAMRGLGPAGSVDGFDVVEGGESCRDSLPPKCSKTFALPGAGAFFSIYVQEVGGQELMDRILGSLRALPKGYTTVPFSPNAGLDKRVSDMEAAGLEVDLVEVYRPDVSPGVFLGSIPDLGTAVAVGGTVTVTVTSDEPTAGPTAVDLPTSDWAPGDFSMYARIFGVLAVDDEGCAYLAGDAAVRTYAVWPAGFTATVTNDGTLELYGPEGALLARSGDSLAMGGGFTDRGSDLSRPCLPTDGSEVALIQSGVTVVEGADPNGPDAAPVDLPNSDWKPGEGGDQMLIAGQLAIDSDNCVYLTSDGGTSRSWPVWPAGYTATVSGGGDLTLFDATGAVVALDGDNLEMGGGGGSRTLVTDETNCLPDVGTVLFVQSGVTVVD